MEATMLYPREWTIWIKGSISPALVTCLCLSLALIEQIKVHWAVCDVDHLRTLAWLSPDGIHSGFRALFPLRWVPGISIRQRAGAGMEAAAALVGSEGSSPLSSLAEMTAGVRGFCCSCNGRSPREMPVLVVSEHMLVLVSYQLHLGCSSPNTSVQLSTATLRAIDF